MRLYTVCLMLLMLGCAASDPEGSLAVKDTGPRFIILHQVDGMSFEGCAEVLLNSNIPGFQVDAKVVDRGVLVLKDNGQWKASLAPTGEGPRYNGDQSRLTLTSAHPSGRGKPLKVCVEVTAVDVRSARYSTSSLPPRFADVYVTIYPPFNP